MIGGVFPRFGLSATIVLSLLNIMLLQTAALSSEIPLEIAQGTVYLPSEPENSDVEQVTSVSQLSDIQTTDWAFQALQSLVERYNCISGYPNGIYQGNRAISRYEFASGLNACLERINELVATGTKDRVPKSDLVVVRQLEEQFAVELATLPKHLSSLENRIDQLATQQFSPTTKLSGIAWFNLTGAGASSPVLAEGSSYNVALRGSNGQPVTRLVSNPSSTARASLFLTLESSFTGKDLLLTNIAVGSGESPANVFNSAGELLFFGVPVSDVNFGQDSGVPVIRELSYTFPVGDALSITVGPRINWARYFGRNQFTLFTTGTSSYESADDNLFPTVARGSGVLAEWNIKPHKLLFRTAYLGRNEEFSALFNDASNPDYGLFNGTNSISAEMVYSPTSKSNIRITYSHNNILPLDGQVQFTPPIQGVADDGFGGTLDHATANIIGVNFDWKIGSKFGIFGRFGYSDTELYPIAAVPRGNVAAQDYQLGVAFPDLGRRGALGTISYVVPYVLLNGRQYLVAGGGNGGVQYNIETTYSLPLSNNISLIPAFYLIGNPNNFTGNPTIYVGNCRLQFSF